MLAVYLEPRLGGDLFLCRGKAARELPRIEDLRKLESQKASNLLADKDLFSPDPWTARDILCEVGYLETFEPKGDERLVALVATASSLDRKVPGAALLSPPS